MKIPVVIFCGGQGTRMKEETEFRPKPMVSIGGKPILWHIMKIYSHFGFNDFIIALGYKGDYIKEYFLNEEYFIHDITINTSTGKKNVHRESRKKHDKFNITFVDTGLETPTGERLLRVKKYIKTDTFMVTYGDGIGNVPVKQLIQHHKSSNVIGTITSVHPRAKWGVFFMSKNNMIDSFEQKPQLDLCVNGGFMVFQKEVFQYLKHSEMIETSFSRLIQDKQLGVFVHDGFWASIDTYQEVEELNLLWKKNPQWKIWR